MGITIGGKITVSRVSSRVDLLVLGVQRADIRTRVTLGDSSGHGHSQFLPDERHVDGTRRSVRVGPLSTAHLHLVSNVLVRCDISTDKVLTRNYAFAYDDNRLGHAGIFLLGGTTRQTPPIPIVLRSGDVLVMAGRGRKCYHGQ